MVELYNRSTELTKNKVSIRLHNHPRGRREKNPVAALGRDENGACYFGRVCHSCPTVLQTGEHRKLRERSKTHLYNH